MHKALFNRYSLYLHEEARYNHFKEENKLKRNDDIHFSYYCIFKF